MTINSSNGKVNRNLARGHDAGRRGRKFLEDLANSSDEDLPRFERRYGEVFQPYVPLDALRSWMLTIGDIAEKDSPDLMEDSPDPANQETIREYWLKPFRNAIRKIWLLPDLRSKRWAVHKVLEQFLSCGDKRFNFTPMGESFADAFLDTLGPPTRLEQVLEVLAAERSHHLARICSNPDCHSPYFFASSKRPQKYCSGPCAIPAQREAKRRWWKKAGSSMRSERAAARGGHSAKASKSPISVGNKRAKKAR